MGLGINVADGVAVGLVCGFGLCNVISENVATDWLFVSINCKFTFRIAVVSFGSSELSFHGIGFARAVIISCPVIVRDVLPSPSSALEIITVTRKCCCGVGIADGVAVGLSSGFVGEGELVVSGWVVGDIAAEGVAV